jgi:hypothetical protein
MLLLVSLTDRHKHFHPNERPQLVVGKTFFLAVATQFRFLRVQL